MSNNFHLLKVEQIRQEIPDASSIFFELPPDLKETFAFEAGQYLTLKFKLVGIEYRRAYSICTSPLDKALAVTVKRVDGGKISNHINDNLKAGDSVEVMIPIGKFTTALKATQKNDYYFFAGGSGITPMMSIIKTVLRQEPQSRCNLLYGSRDEESIIFKKELATLVNQYPNQLNIRHILSTPKLKKAGGLAGLFGKKKQTWQGWTGFLDKSKINEFLANNAPKGNNQKYLICGPEIMMKLVTNSLKALTIPDEEVMVEYFSSPKSEKTKREQPTFSGPAQLKITLQGTEHSLEINDDTSILDALVKTGSEPPFSCSSGACSTCVAKVTKGSVSMDTCFALEADEIKAGLVLTCQSHPTSKEVELTYDI